MRVRLLLVASLIVLVSCGAPGGTENRGPGAAARPRAYMPPADGRLTDAQVAKYVAFLQNRARISPAEADSEGDSRIDREAEAARSLGVSPDEIRWIGQKVLEARIRIAEKEAERRNLDTYRATLVSLRKALDASTDPATRSTVSRQIGELERESAEIERSLRRPTERVLASNQALVLHYRVDLDAARGILPATH
jgi:hypothetical protein